MERKNDEKPIYKIYEVKAAEMQENRIRGVANVMGILDRGYDVTFPGFFRKALADFRKNGFVAVGHDWGDLPVAMPTKAQENGNLLETESEFHSTQRAQDARTVCQERIAKNLSVGLSVGFMPDYAKSVKWYETGADLLKDAEKMGCDLDLFDVKAIKAHKNYCRGLHPDGCSELYEYSIVTVPMNHLSTVTEAKGALKMFTVRDVERILVRDAEKSRNEARRILSGYADQWDADEADQPIIADETTEEPLRFDVEGVRRKLFQLRADVLSVGV